MQELGWPFKDGYEDSLYGAKFIREIYFKAQPDYSGRFTVPVLWDKKTQTIGKPYVPSTSMFGTKTVRNRSVTHTFFFVLYLSQQRE